MAESYYAGHGLALGDGVGTKSFPGIGNAFLSPKQLSRLFIDEGLRLPNVISNRQTTTPPCNIRQMRLMYSITPAEDGLLDQATMKGKKESWVYRGSNKDPTNLTPPSLTTTLSYPEDHTD